MKYSMTAAVIGTGYIGEKHVIALKDNVEKIILYGNDEQSGKALAEKYDCLFYNDYENMLANENIDFAIICVPTPLHNHFTVDLLNRKVNVLCEKPFASTIQEAEQMISKAELNNVKLMVGHCVRFSKEYEYLRRCVKDNRFGKLSYLNLFRNGPKPLWSVGNWLHNVSKSGGAVRDLHIHDTDIIKNSIGIPNTVYTKATPLLCSTIYDYGNDMIVTACGTWRYASEYEFNSGFDACFEHGVITCKNKIVTVFNDEKSYNPLDDEQFPEYLSSEDAYKNEQLYFCKCISENLEIEFCHSRDSLESLKINFAEAKSVETGEIVKVDV